MSIAIYDCQFGYQSFSSFFPIHFSPSSRLTDRYTDRGRLSVASNWSGGFSMDLTYRDYL